jgi:maltooligosyltrehalose trehalohydrolase
LLGPEPPLLFMGEEFGASTPFLFFCDFAGELAAAVTRGRRNEFASFSKFSSAELLEQIPNPNADETFLASKLDWTGVSEEPHSTWLGFYQHLLRIRQQSIVPHLLMPGEIKGQCRSEKDGCLAVNWSLGGGSVLKLRANLRDQTAAVSPDSGKPVYASSLEILPAFGRGALPRWSVLWLIEE